TNAEAGIARSNPSDGSYKIVLPLGKVYSFVAAKDGFFPVSDTISVKNVSGYQEITRDLYLTPIEVGQTIRLNNIFFDFNKSDLLPSSYAELDRLVKLLNAQPNMQIEISGHTDNVGGDDYNQKLSQSRVRSVFDYLVSKSVDKSRLIAKGYGKAKPIASNDTEEGRAKNR